MHISTAKYLTPLGVDLSEQGGIVPDQEIALTAKADTQLNAAISAVQMMM